jgi:AcrR family transcriptional regulator
VIPTGRNTQTDPLDSVTLIDLDVASAESAARHQPFRYRGERSEQRSYHHGHLREALVEAGVELARAGGPSAVLLRAVTRQAGVSPSAAYRHFANQQDLLAAVAERCMTRLGLLMIERSQQVTARGPVRQAQARLEAIGRAYIDFARTEPGWFRTAFSSAQPHPADRSGRQPSLADSHDVERTSSPYLILGAQLDELVAVGALTPQRRRGAELAAWSAVHGLSSLLLDGPLRDPPEPQADYAISTVLAAIGRGLQ